MLNSGNKQPDLLLLYLLHIHLYQRLDLSGVKYIHTVKLQPLGTVYPALFLLNVKICWGFQQAKCIYMYWYSPESITGMKWWMLYNHAGYDIYTNYWWNISGFLEITTCIHVWLHSFKHTDIEVICRFTELNSISLHAHNILIMLICTTSICHWVLLTEVTRFPCGE